MKPKDNRLEPGRLELPASSWWIPTVTVVIVVLAVVAALA